ncbi:MAG TPA: aldehyde ferredoxin oxidoreductase N-terminal domain-containing protein [Thermodesulfobacteriota bacterium]|nr:aldehyde ferredoxin oxidoreductase N-terminal domain-containing protein [Thermodesulfobacteriota bacterium]
MNGWRGKRLCIDLGLQRSWVEEIPVDELESYLGGRGLNAAYFLKNVDKSTTTSSSQSTISLSVGPLSGTVAACSGWTSISVFSGSNAPSYEHVSMPGHWGPQLKFCGFDQLVIQGKSERPVYIVVDGKNVRFKDGKPLWGKNIEETVVGIQEAEGQNTQILSIGPAGERLVRFANVTNGLSWTADHIGLGYAFGSKNLKAIAARGDKPVTLDQSDRFLRLCLDLRERIYRDQKSTQLGGAGSFFFLGQNGGGLGIKNYTEWSSSDFEKSWKIEYLKEHLFGCEGCFSCPIHCGRISHINGDVFGGTHLESAWSLGPRIGIFDWAKTLRILRICQMQGLDPSAVGSLVAWLMDCYEKRIFSIRELGLAECPWGSEATVVSVLERIMEGEEGGEILREGSLGAARALKKGLEFVPHFCGMDLPVRDPRSSAEYTHSRAFFPGEWDYLQSFTPGTPLSSSVPSEAEDNKIVEKISGLEKLRVLADLNSICPLVVARLPLITGIDVGNLLLAATGSFGDVQTLRAAVDRTMHAEKTLMEENQGGGPDPFPVRFFENGLERNNLQKKIKDYNRCTKSPV